LRVTAFFVPAAQNRRGLLMGSLQRCAMREQCRQFSFAETLEIIITQSIAILFRLIHDKRCIIMSITRYSRRATLFVSQKTSIFASKIYDDEFRYLDCR
jgi:hypothetical protein